MMIFLICGGAGIIALISILVMNSGRVGKELFRLNLGGAPQRLSKGKDPVKTRVNGVLTDYNTYYMTMEERVRYTVLAAVLLSSLGFVFFRNIYMCFVLSFFSILYPNIKTKALIKKRKSTLTLQFKDVLYTVSSSLSAGKSVERAFKDSLEDLAILYPNMGNNAVSIINEIDLINRRVEMNDTLENGLRDFAARAHCEDITSFVEVFSICKSTGGNLVEVIKNTCSVINQKIEIKSEIEVLAAEQRMSQKILNIMPIAILLLITAGSPDYVEPLYSVKGNFIMSIVLAMIAAAYFISNKIMDIKV